MDAHEIRTLDALESKHWWYIIRKQILKEWASQFSVGKNFLDLGSASGGNTQLLISMGFDVTSIEFSQVGVELQQKKGIQVIQGDARATGLPENEFDACICLDVLEHIQEDYLVVNEIFRILKPGGKFLISVPEDMSLWSMHDVAVSHIRRYNRKELNDLLISAGFSISDSRSVNVLIKSLIKFKRRFSKTSDLDSVPDLVNRILLLIAKLDWKVNRSSWSGVTIWISGIK